LSTSYGFCLNWAAFLKATTIFEKQKKKNNNNNLFKNEGKKTTLVYDSFSLELCFYLLSTFSYVTAT